MIRIKCQTNKIILLFSLTAVLLYGQNKSPFYINLTAIQEYHSNIHRLPDSLHKADNRFNSFARFGYQKNWVDLKKHLNMGNLLLCDYKI